MSNKRKPWTAEETARAAQLRADGYMYAEIDAMLGRVGGSTCGKLTSLRLPDICRARVHGTRVRYSEIPQRVIDERDRIRDLEHRDITAALMGDPLPGRSALDRRRAVRPEIVK